MQTECPHCHTVFGINQEQLDQAEGQLRCGHCLAIFTADISSPDLNAESEEAIVNSFSDQTEQESTDVDAPLADVIPANLRAESHTTKTYGFFGSIFWSLAILTALAGGILQYAYHERIKLVQIDELRPWLEKMCHYAQCELPEARDPGRIKLNNKNIFSHPNIKNALMISANIINQAAFEQAFPLLELKFENIRGQTIAGRRFTPEEYLGISLHQISTMSPGEPVSISIEIIDPGKEMVSYTFEFL